MKQKFTVNVDGIELTLVSDEDREFIDRIVGIVTEKIRAVKNATNSTTIDASILCALDCCSEKLYAEKKVKNVEAQLALFTANVNRLRVENEELKNKLEAK